MSAVDSLREYRKKRDFSKTKEPNSGKSSKKAPIFVVQEHWASHHHYDFRLEAFGTLKSWAVPKGPSTEVGDKRLAVEVEDHPIDYASFHGTIPEGEYGAGKVKIWDKGNWIPPSGLKENLEKGHLEFELKGKKLKGKWLLQRTGRSSGRKSQWLLIKRHDQPRTSKVEATRKKLLAGKTKKDPWPTDLKPQLATLAAKVPPGGDWIHEIKLDGYRTLAHVKGKTIQMRTRSGLDWTEKYSPLDEEFKKLKVDSAIFDGEIVAVDSEGRSDFSALQKALKEESGDELRYYLFDLLYLNGRDLREEPLETRKQILKTLLDKAKSKTLLFSSHLRGQGEELFSEACRKGLEGIVAKSRARAYREGRSDDWVKVKCSLRQEFVIGGYTDPSGSRTGIGALLMGVYEDGKFKYVGRVGIGFDAEMLGLVYEKVSALETDKSPFEINGPKASRGTHWTKPSLVSEVEFRAWTADGVLRQASFQGLREDKKAKSVVLEKPKDLKSEKTAKRGKTARAEPPQSKLKPGAFKITHPERVLYPKKKVTKLDVASYYRSVAPWLLRHTANRPLSLVRCTDTVGDGCFFQKHLDTSRMHSVGAAVASAEGEKDQKINFIEDLSGLLELVQWGVLEIHTWQTHADHVEYPDQLIFDLDPDESVKWKEVVVTAFELRDLLDRLSLRSFVKTTGGKGLHLHVPIAPVYSWQGTKEFSKSVARQLDAENPGRYTSKMSKKLRKGKIFIDYLRNGFGATAIAPYSLRSKEEPFASVPITWEELKELKGPQYFTKDRVLERLAKEKADPWPGYAKLRQKIRILKT